MIGGVAKAVKVAHFLQLRQDPSQENAEGLRMAWMRLLSERQIAGLSPQVKAFSCASRPSPYEKATRFW